MRTTKTRTILVALGALLIVGSAWAADRGIRNDKAVQPIIDRLVQQYGRDAATTDVYVGTDACLGCHQDYKGFKDSMHHTGLKMVRDDKFSLKLKNGIMADYDRNGVDDFKQGLDFNKIASIYDRYKPNAPILGYTAGKGYTMSIAGIEYPVVFTHGGTGLSKQRYAVRIPVTDRPSGLSADLYYAPIQYNDTSGSYVLYSTGNWYNADNTPRIRGPIASSQAASTGNSFHKGCAGCHGFGVKAQKDALGEWQTTAQSPVYTPPGEPHYLDLDGNGWAETYNIGCERCHGPGSRHIINLGDKTKVINPGRNYTAMQKNELCGSCHTRGTSSAGTFGYPYNETTGEDYSLHIGAPLDSKFWRPNPNRWPDGRNPTQHRQQLDEMKLSSKWEYQHHKVYCTECHDPHYSGQKAQMRKTVNVTGSSGNALTINVKVEDNTLCLSCHAGFGPFAPLKREDIQDINKNWNIIANTVSAHTKHPYSPQARMGMSRCTECHMPKVAASGDPYDVSTHTFEAISPEKTLKYQANGGMPNSCAVRCHRPMATIFGLPADSSLTTWNEKSDVATAEWLQTYFGPNGVWWKTAK